MRLPLDRRTTAICLILWLILGAFYINWVTAPTIEQNRSEPRSRREMTLPPFGAEKLWETATGKGIHKMNPPPGAEELWEIATAYERMEDDC